MFTSNNTRIYQIFLLIVVLIICLTTISETAPVSDSANAYRILSRYMSQLNDPELDSAGYIVFDDKS